MANGIPPGRDTAASSDATPTVEPLKVGLSLVALAVVVGFVPVLLGAAVGLPVVGLAASITLLVALVCVSVVGSAWYVTEHGLPTGSEMTTDDLSAREIEMIAIYQLTHGSLL